ncbi:hypothetical protein RHGRI_013908 [Rhododendron griersonianum]|uniref:Uncharacterized protein n=1 Tax=Rhododendron griersonianum TaxID=479676 RepID=A0AAV6K7G7_9ERIC|nr:hypothetical protein RHGRI_013908 [Rhododendron griersonianum]
MSALFFSSNLGCGSGSNPDRRMAARTPLVLLVGAAPTSTGRAEEKRTVREEKRREEKRREKWEMEMKHWWEMKMNVIKWER